MLIGDKQSENKLYRGIKYYNGLPLTSEDRHEDADLVSRKTALLTNNVIGNGPLNEPSCIISDSGISLSEPSAVLIDGDVSLIQSDGGFPLVYLSDINLAGYTDGILCIVGWYQHLDSYSTIKAYGGVRNSNLDNDLVDTRFGVQVSTRYQFRWDTVLVDYSAFTSGNPFTVSLVYRNEDGTVATPTVIDTLSVPGNSDIVKVLEVPSNMSYSSSSLYLVPILRYKYTDGVITYAKTYRSVKPVASPQVIHGSSKPTGEFREGTYWYNPENNTFQMYIAGGFASSSMSLRQYTNTVTLENETLSPSNIDISIGIEQYTRGDALLVVYEGAVLVEGINYTIDNSGSKITLSSFTSKSGDKVTLIVTKLVIS